MIQGSSHLRRNVEDSDSSISCVSYFIISTNKYKKGHTQRSLFEENIVDLMATAYTPLSLVDCRELSKLISSLDLRIVPVLKSRLSIKLILLKCEAFNSDVTKVLKNFPYVVLRFDLWMSVKNEDIFQFPPIVSRN